MKEDIKSLMSKRQREDFSQSMCRAGDKGKRGHGAIINGSTPPYPQPLSHNYGFFKDTVGKLVRMGKIKKGALWDFPYLANTIALSASL